MQQPVIGKFLRALREEHGLSAKELSEQIGASHTTVARWEDDGTTPQKKYRRALERVYNLTPHALDAGSEYLAGVYDAARRVERVVVKMLASARAEDEPLPEKPIRPLEGEEARDAS